METVILGAGAAGLTLAVNLALAGDHVTVIEREPQPGGLAAGFAVGDTTLEKFYHHLFESDTAIIALLKKIGLSDDLIWGAPSTSSLIGGQPWRLDSARAVLAFRPLPPLARLRMGAAIGFLRTWPSYKPLEAATAAAWMRRWMGRRAYEVQWQPLLAGKFGEYADQISMAWMWARLHCRTPRLGYLRGGFQRFYDRMAIIANEVGATLRFRTSATAIRPEHDGRLRVELAGNAPVHADRVVCTLPTRLALRLLPTLPTFQRRYDWGQAFGAHCLILALDQPLTDVYWLNINDPGYPFLAAVEHTNFIPPEQYGGRHLLYLGNYLPMDHPLFAKDKATVLAEFVPHLKRLNPHFEPGWVQESWLFAAPFAQPIVTPEFHAHIPPHQTPIPGVYLANMFQIYPQDRGQNYAVAMAERLAGELIAAR